ncbi:MAG TPA: hypothetical protein VG711_08145 [Phycisphaerales bacterium]|nr:hypothetical protein [Phycisphaerales bacterium]
MSPDKSHADSFTHETPAPNAPIGVIVGDRLCTGCGYNLVGQTITREPHYNLFITRCPECGTVAALQEYPQLGKWANRWAAVLAGLWLVFMVLAMVASGAVIFGLSAGAHEIATESYGAYLSEKASNWISAHTQIGSAASAPSVIVASAAPATPMVMSATSRTRQDFFSFWGSQDQAAMLSDAGGLFGVVDWWSMSLMYAALCLVTFLFGCFWAALLLGRKAFGRCIVGVLILLISCAFGAILVIDAYGSLPTYTWLAAEQQVGIPWLYITIVFSAIPLMLGLVLGRALVRALLTLLLPPRFRSSLAMLWTTDGQPPPAPR